MSTTYSITRDQIISSALRKLQVLELGVTPDADTVSNAAQALNVMIKAWQARGIKLWTIDEYVLPLVANQTSYTISPSGSNLTASKPLKVIQAWLRDTSVTPNVDTPLTIISKQEYNLLSSKASTGRVNSIMYDPRVTSGKLYTYLTPDSTTATNYTLYFVGQRPMTDIDSSSSVPDFPTEWTQALVWGLADELAIEYGCHVNIRNEVAIKAKLYQSDLEEWDTENTSIYFSPQLKG